MAEPAPPPAAPATPPANITIRAPTTSPPTWTPPPLAFLLGTWHVTHSTLPMWRKNRNVAITYSAAVPEPTAAAAPPPRLRDHVSYQPLNADKQKSVLGIDTPAGADTSAWNWRGSGWLVIASSHWEVLGYGGEEAEREQWAVTYFAKTLFTPEGIDIYSRKKEGLSEGTLGKIMEALKGVDAVAVQQLVGDIFVVKSDHYKS